LVSFNDYPLGDVEGNATAGASGGSGGISPTAGASGSFPTKRENLIDDFEDGNAAIITQQGRVGSWYVGNDGMGTQTPRMDQPVAPIFLQPARGPSQRAAHTFGGPFAGWGALIGTAFGPDAYDLSGYSGLRLWVRTTTSGEVAQSVRINLPMPGTNAGGDCSVCSDHFGADIPLTSVWTQLSVPFSSLRQRGFGQPQLSEPDLAHVTSLQLSFAGGVAFDLWLDDVELY
jgi:hypothetical protein